MVLSIKTNPEMCTFSLLHSGPCTRRILTVGVNVAVAVGVMLAVAVGSTVGVIVGAVVGIAVAVCVSGGGEALGAVAMPAGRSVSVSVAIRLGVDDGKRSSV